MNLQNHIFQNQTTLVNDLLNKEIFSFDEIENYPRNEYQEIYEWWSVSDFFSKKLNTLKAPILKTPFGNWWRRTSTGELLENDGILAKAKKEMEKMILN